MECAGIPWGHKRVSRKSRKKSGVSQRNTHQSLTYKGWVLGTILLRWWLHPSGPHPTLPRHPSCHPTGCFLPLAQPSTCSTSCPGISIPPHAPRGLLQLLPTSSIDSSTTPSPRLTCSYYLPRTPSQPLQALPRLESQSPALQPAGRLLSLCLQGLAFTSDR